MKSSVSSSAIPSPARPPTDSSGTPPRRSFALAGPSTRLDPLRNAVRSDLADVRLADRVFAPHYAQAVQRSAVHETALRSTRGNGDAIGTLRAGDLFEVLEFSKGQAWGVAPASGLVGYVATDALNWDAP